MYKSSSLISYVISEISNCLPRLIAWSRIHWICSLLLSSNSSFLSFPHWIRYAQRIQCSGFVGWFVRVHKGIFWFGFEENKHERHWKQGVF